MKKYYISFVGEGIMNPNPKYDGYIAGRVEVYDDSSPYDIDEYRVFTNKIKEFDEYIDPLDLKTISLKKLKEIKKTVKEQFYNPPE